MVILGGDAYMLLGHFLYFLYAAWPLLAGPAARKLAWIHKSNRPKDAYDFAHGFMRRVQRIAASMVNLCTSLRSRKTHKMDEE
jgi:hypothetical protein